MKFFKITLVFVFLLSTNIFSQDITTIELHSPSIDYDVIFSEENKDSNSINEIDAESLAEQSVIEENTEDESLEEENIIKENSDILNENSDEINITKEDIEIQKKQDSQMIVSLLDYWEISTRDDLDFLFNNMHSSTSKVLNSYFVNTLTEFSKPPQSYNQAEFDNLRVKTLIKMEKRKEALAVLNNISTYETYKNYYDRIKLNSYLATNELFEACSFKDSLQNFTEDRNNIILKVSIFCAFLENKTEEADLLNSLLLDTQDKDDYFQKIYFNLKNNIIEPIDIVQGSFDESSFSLYSAMIRIGNLPFTEKFLEFDLTNLTLPIILNSETDISLRLKSAHKAYELGLFNSESLSALYQSVDFFSEELNNWKESLEKYTSKPEIGMALLFQNSRIQLLPITRLESLKEFWNYAINNNFEKLAYDVSRNLIESTQPSVELSDYSILLARAHIFNKNFQQAEKWILFVENYVSKSNELDQADLDKIKFSYNLQKSEEKDTFIRNLEENLIIKIKKEEMLNDYNETLKTIFSIILNDKDVFDKIKYEEKIIDERSMPSSFIINNINDSSENNKIGELILTALVSLDEKTWIEIHPQYLKILLQSIKNAKLDNLFQDLIIEIFKECKII